MAKRKPEPPEPTPVESAPSTDTTPETGTYTVLARRYRPQLFDELVGQEHVAQALVNALQSGRVAHAYLFTGARGVGKTSTARILAKCLNCEKGPTATPCNVCEICRSITAGDDMDVLEIDGASNRGINEVREIRANVQYRPGRGRFKIYIIDEVHMLTKEAFNALLKTLEEPPPHVKFIFATTEVQKIPITILSRCQRFDFAGISVPRIVQQLKQIVEREGLQADAEALEIVARRAGGSMRDAQSLLDQLLAFAPDRLTVDQVHQQLGTARDERVLTLVDAIVQKDAAAALQQLASAADEGLDLGELLDQFIEYWRDLMVVNSAGLEGQVVSVGSGHRDTLAKHAKALSLDGILAGLDVLVSARMRLQRGSGHTRVLLEMAVVRLTRLGDLIALGQLAQWLRNPRNAPARPASSGTAIPASSIPGAGDAKKKPLNGSGPDSSSGGPLAHVGAATSQRGEPAAATAALATPAISLTPETLPQVWARVLQLLGFATGSELKPAFAAISGPNLLAIRFGPGYNDQRVKYQQPTQVARIEEALASLIGPGWRVRIESDPTSETAASSTAAVLAVEPLAVRTRRNREDLARAELLKSAFDTLAAQVVRQDEGFDPTVESPPAPRRADFADED